MSEQTYTCRRYRSIGAFTYRADFAQAAHGIYVNFCDWADDEEWQPMPFQVADCRHDRREAERMIAAYFR